MEEVRESPFRIENGQGEEHTGDCDEKHCEGRGNGTSEMDHLRIEGSSWRGDLEARVNNSINRLFER